MPEATLQTTSERIDKDRVKLRVEVPAGALEKSLAETYKRWANDIKVPGFRKGKVPRQLIDQRVGPEVIREEALRDALPDFYLEALRTEELEAIAPPEIEVIDFEDGAPIVFEATVDVRPEITLPELSSLSVVAPPAEVTDEDINEQLERLRDRFAELETVSRDARRGDFALIDLKGYQNEQLVEGASAPDLLYEVGSRSGPPKLDDELEGSRPGAILKFSDSVHIHTEDEPEHDHSHMEDISFTVLVKEVKAKKLPTLDDEFAKTVGEFDTMDALKDDLRTRLDEVKKNVVEEEVRVSVLNALVDASDLEPPEKLVEEEFTHRMEHFGHDLSQAGMTMEAYGEQVQLTELEIRRDIRAQSGRSVKAELLLEEVARQQEVEVTDEDLGREIAILAARTQQQPQDIAKSLAESGRVRALAADIMRRKALDYLVENVNVSDNEGTT
ncbi:MAG: trigger factor [Actinomycetota bacterium]|jgi:trigger factor|nr:trigger factor [Actinomycetota bacterium]